MERYYCGPYYCPKPLRKRLSKYFNSSCRLHDIHYSQKKISRKTADKLFLKNMLMKAPKLRDKIIAYLFFGLVRLFGWISWKTTK
jgi:hypothetical protein